MMTMSLSFFALSLALLSTFFSSPSYAVYSGRRVAENDFYRPMAHFVWKKDDRSPRLICGGTLITWRHVITAAHCNPSPKKHFVIIGTRKLYDKTEGVKLSFEKVHVCNDYECEYHFNDLTIIRLEASSEEKLRAAGIRPIEILWDASSFKRNTKLEVLGFGGKHQQEDMSVVSPRLQVGSSFTCKNRKCREMYMLSENPRESICLDGRESSACKGDSGGPVVRTGEGVAHPRLVGVVSGGEPTDSTCKQGEIWHAVNLEAHKGWITDCVGQDVRWCHEDQCPAPEDD